MKRRACIFPAVLVLLVAGVYCNSFRGIFQFDDYNVIVDNAAVHSWSAWFAGLPHGIRPLLKATYVANWTSGFGLFGFHLFNLAVHAGNSLLVYLLGVRFARRHAPGDTPAAEAAAFLGALVFALHPVQTEAVTYICGRSTSLMTLFYLGSVYAYIRGTEGSRLLLNVVSPLLFVLAILVKETAVTLPAAILLWEISAGERKGLAVLLRRQFPHLLVLGAVCTAVALHPLYSWLFRFSFDIRPLYDNLLGQIRGITYLAGQFFLLYSGNIDPDIVPPAGWDLALALQGMFIVLLLASGFAAVRTRPWLAFPILWFFLHLLPTNSAVPRLDIANDRQLYLPGVGLYIFIPVLLLRMGRIWAAANRLVVPATALLVLVLGSSTMGRNTKYRSEIDLWLDTARKSPRKARVHNNLGYAYFLAGRPREAREEYLMALRLKPDFPLARNNLADAETMLEREREGKAGTVK